MESGIRYTSVGIRYARFGNGDKTMVVIPGLTVGYVTNNKQALEDAFRDFVRDYTVYVLDVRDDVPAGYTIQQMSEDAAAAITELGLEKVYLYGCSMGGMQSIYVTAHYPGLVRAAVIASSLCRANETSDAVIGHWISLAKEHSPHALASDMGRRIYSKNMYEMNREAFDLMAEGMTDELLDRFNKTASATIGLDLIAEAADIKCPVLAMGAHGDAVLTGQGSVEIAEFSGGQLYMYGKEYPHAVYDEAPDFKERVKNFFDQN